MNREEYRDLALRTACITDKPVTIEANTFNLLHAAMGICTEVAEIHKAIVNFDRPNLFEECGDTFWYANLGVYITGLMDGCNIDLGYLDEVKITGCEVDAMIGFSGDLMDVMKRKLYYPGYVLDTNMVCDILSGLVSNMVSLMRQHKLTEDKALDANIAKLKARFPDQFSGARALNRDLEKEQDALES